MTGGTPGRPAGSGGRWIGQTGLRLALLFVGVAVVSIGTVLAVAAAAISSDLNRLDAAQQADITHALAAAARDTYALGSWTPKELKPITSQVEQAGGAAQIRGRAGRVITQTPGFARFPAVSERHEPVVVNGTPVGSVTVRFDDRGLAAAVAQFEDLRWHIRIAGAAAALLVTLVVSLVVSRWITAPVDRLARAARARGAGIPGARAGKTKGVAEVRELMTAFDQMADSLDGEARVRRNMVADIAHELRTPIAVLQAGSEAMLDGVTEPSAANLSALHAEIVRLGQMVDDLQALASAEAAALQLNLARSDLGAIAAQAADGLAETFDAAGVRLVRRLADVPVRCDQRRIHEVAVNLLVNAAKFTPAGGTVTLETGLAGQAGPALLRVADTGVGIPAAELPHVTERFFRGRRASAVAGSGIGLAIVDQLASAHHGRLDIRSKPGLGTTVTVMLPADRAGRE